jgi:uncharacterized repeat protein (TIGR01451 family)
MSQRIQIFTSAAATLFAVVLAALLATHGVALAQSPFTFTKTPSPTTYTAAGQTITYTYVITNNGSSFARLVNFVDDKVPSVFCQSSGGAPAGAPLNQASVSASSGSSFIPPGGTLTCTGTYEPGERRPKQHRQSRNRNRRHVRGRVQSAVPSPGHRHLRRHADVDARQDAHPDHLLRRRPVHRLQLRFDQYRQCDDQHDRDLR